MNRSACVLLFAALAVSPLTAQASDWRPQVSLPSVEFWRAPSTLLGTPFLSRPAAPDLGVPATGATRFSAWIFDPEVEKLGSLLATQPPRTARSGLDAGEAELRFHALPGGIVFGETARGVPVGAALGWNSTGRLVLTLVDGRALLCPAIEPASLRAFLAFARAEAGREALIDIAFGRPRLAPAFAGTPLEPRLIALDRLPHRWLPETRAWKSVIVDREVRCETRGDHLLLSAELELRFYTMDEGPGSARRVLTLDVGSATSEVSSSLENELAPLREIAAWIGFLRSVGEDTLGLANVARESVRSALDPRE